MIFLVTLMLLNFLNIYP